MLIRWCPPYNVSYSYAPDIIYISHTLSITQRDLAALEKQVALLSQEAKRLGATYPEKADHVRQKERQTLAIWRGLVERAGGRKSKLVEAEQLQRLLNDFRDLRCLYIYTKQMSLATEPLSYT